MKFKKIKLKYNNEDAYAEIIDISIGKEKYFITKGGFSAPNFVPPEYGLSITYRLHKDLGGTIPISMNSQFLTTYDASTSDSIIQFSLKKLKAEHPDFKDAKEVDENG
jgi:hypothetical protein